MNEPDANPGATPGATPDGDELRRRLEAAGRRPVPGPDAAFASRLEDRLRAVASTAGAQAGSPLAGAPAHASPSAAAPATVSPSAGGPAAGSPVGGPRDGGRSRPWFRSPLALATASVLVVLLGVGAVVRTVVPEAPALRLVAAVDAVVTLPDGTSVAAEPGLELAEGMIVRTGQSGRVVVGTIELGPRSAAVVRDGRLEPFDPRIAAAPTPEPTERPRSGLVPPVRTLPLVPSSPGGTSERPSPRPSDRPADRPADQPSDRPTTQATEPSKRPEPRPTDSPAADRPDHAFAEPDDRHALGIGVMALRDGTYFVSWTEYEHPELFGFVILRADEPAVPEWPADRATTVAGRAPAGGDPVFHDRDPRATRPVYRVVALTEDGRELARSAALAAR